MEMCRRKLTQALIPETTYYVGNYFYINHTGLSLTQGKEEIHGAIQLNLVKCSLIFFHQNYLLKLEKPEISAPKPCGSSL